MQVGLTHPEAAARMLINFLPEMAFWAQARANARLPSVLHAIPRKEASGRRWCFPGKTFCTESEWIVVGLNQSSCVPPKVRTAARRQNLRVALKVAGVTGKRCFQRTFSHLPSSWNISEAAPAFMFLSPADSSAFRVDVQIWSQQGSRRRSRLFCRNIIWSFEKRRFTKAAFDFRAPAWSSTKHFWSVLQVRPARLICVFIANTPLLFSSSAPLWKETWERSLMTKHKHPETLVSPEPQTETLTSKRAI